MAKYMLKELIDELQKALDEYGDLPVVSEDVEGNECGIAWGFGRRGVEAPFEVYIEPDNLGMEEDEDKFEEVEEKDKVADYNNGWGGWQNADDAGTFGDWDEPF